MYDVYKIRKQFPMLENNIKMQHKPLVFLDNCSTTFKPQCVIDAEMEYYTLQTSNAHRGDYDLSVVMDNKIEEARLAISHFVNCEQNEVVFTSGTTASLNLVAFGYGLKFLKPGDEIIISEAEHASNILPWFEVSKLTGANVKYIPFDEDGRLTIDNLLKVISNNTKIVSIAHVGNVLGYTTDVKGMAQVAHKFGAIMVVDGAQSVPHLKTDFKDLDCDFLAFSAHKMCGPTGIGALIGKYELLDKMNAYTVGGGNNSTFDNTGSVNYRLPPAKFEAGTQNIAAILGFKKAVEFIMDIGIDNIHTHDAELVRYAKDQLKDYEKFEILNPLSENGIITFNIKGVFAQDEATLLNYNGIAIRSGEHCAKMLHAFLKTKATCRMSTYLYTTKEDIDAFVEAIKNGGDILDAYFND